MDKLEGGVYEVFKDGKIQPATQGLVEHKDKVAYRVFGGNRVSRIIPIDEVCAECDFWKEKFASVEVCQYRQREDATARGFTKVICPKQFKEE